MECVGCGREDAVPYKCPRCLTARYCSAACCKVHLQASCLGGVGDGTNATNTVTTAGTAVDEQEEREEGQVEQDADHMAALRTNEEIAEWMAKNQGLVESIITAPDPVLSVQRHRRSNEAFNSISKLILDILIK